LALFVALGGSSYAAVRVGSPQIKNNTVRSVDLKNNDIRSGDIRNGTIQGKDIHKGTLLASNFKAGQLPAGTAGQPGPQGPPGPSFGDTKKIDGVTDIACNAPVVVGSMPVTTKQPTRIWASAQGSIQNGDTPPDEEEFFVQLRNAGGVVATSPAIWDAQDVPGNVEFVSTMSTAGVMHAGTEPDADNPAAYVAVAGTYTLELVTEVDAADCSSGKPDFGWNSDGSLSYILLGTG
jgi:hypothetical protein